MIRFTEKRFHIGLRWFVFVAFCVMAGGMASDLQRGITFSPTEHITNVKLHNLIDQTSISTHFVTDLAIAQPALSDVLPFVQPGTPIYRKVTYQAFIQGLTNVITSEVDTPATNDFLYIFQSSSGTLNKTPVQAFFTNTWWITGLTDYTNLPTGGFSYPYVSNGVPYRIEQSNLFAGWWQWERFTTNSGSAVPQTNPPILTLHTAPTNSDLLRIWDSVNGTNKATTLAGLMTNLFAVPEGKLTNNDSLMVFSRATNASANATGVVAQVSLTNLAHFVAQKFTTNGFPVPTGAGTTGYTNNHGLAGTPQFWKAVIVCTNAELSFLVGDEVDLTGALASGTGLGINSTQFWFSVAGGATYTVQRRDNGSAQAITKANWNIRFDAIFYP